MSKYDFSSITTLQEANARLAVLISTAEKSIDEAEDLADAFGLEFDLPSGDSQMGDTYVGAGQGKYTRTLDRFGDEMGEDWEASESYEGNNDFGWWAGSQC